MAFNMYFLCVALLCGVRCSPLGQTGSIYDYPPLLPHGATVCESSTNLLGLGLGIGYPYPLNNCPFLPLPYPRNIWGNTPIQPTTTVCETTPNVVSILPFPNLPISGVSSTVCETTPGVVGFLPFPNVPNVGTTSVTETTPTMVPAPAVLPVNPCLPTPTVLPCNPCISPLPYPGLIPGYAPYGMPIL